MVRSKGTGFGRLAAFALLPLSGVALADTVSLLAQRDGPDGGAEAPQPPNGPSVSSVWAYDELFTFPLENGCWYSASIRGTVRPIVAGRDAGQKVEPDLAVTALLSCQGAATVKVSEHVTGTGPITQAQVEHLLEWRASILTDEAGRKCSYVPEIDLVGDGLVGAGVSYLCPRP
ncbi:hypothetical protein [Polyangium sorediatum]|uniref:Lipoprotein n=1 Tax=Polyangium sorediatum TaxID=889274 RepID=A0ABT6NU30_9BACT|nr:hypothetical protein [Polyangium sorediatum]MDI1431824.1 hypothetical protein [Polyangium sorediatum]